MLTYGDCLSDININNLIDFHKQSNKMATLTTMQLPGRFGNLIINNENIVETFQEKQVGDGVWINGGFFVLEPEIFKYLDGNMDDVQWEKGPLINIAKDGNLAAFKHYGFWKCMYALRDRIELEKLWESGNPPWIINKI